MKKCVIVLSVLIFMIGTLLQGCKDEVQKDAQKLGVLQKQENEKVREILKCSDLQTRMILQNEFQILDSKYNTFKQQCEMKYADTLNKRKFDKAFREGLKK